MVIGTWWRLMVISLLYVAAESLSVRVRKRQTLEGIEKWEKCQQAALCFPTVIWQTIQVNETDSWLAIVRRMSAAHGIKPWYAVSMWEEGTVAAFRSKKELRQDQHLVLGSRLPRLDAFAGPDGVVGAIGPLWEGLFALVGGTLMRDPTLMREVAPLLEQEYQTLSCRKWGAVMDHYNAVVQPHADLAGFAAKFVDLFYNPFVTQNQRLKSAVAVFERCMLPSMCAVIKTVVEQPALPYVQTHHFSQVGQDIWALRHFEGKRGGTFVDIGASDGILGSNTYVLEKCFGWRGVCVEARESQMKSLKLVNRSCYPVSAALSNFTGKGKFVYADGSSGLKQFQGQFDAKRQQAQGIETSMGTVDVTTFPVMATAAKLGKQIDFISLDVEGAELAILKTIDFDKYDVGALAVENNAAAPHLCGYMQKNGYRCLGLMHMLDELFIRNPRKLA